MDFSISRKLSRVLLVVLIPLILFITVSGDDNRGKEDMQCGQCNCTWLGGKKAANCRDLRLTEIPHDLSDNLQLIDFSDNKFPEIRREEFLEAKLHNVHKLYLKSCTLMELNRDAFVGLSILIELDLSKNQLRRLIPGTFSSLHKLRKIMLNQNQLEFLPEMLFSNLQYLKTVEFRENQIMRIEPSAFQNLPVLNVIELAFNNLTVIKLDSFQNLGGLVSISLEDNPWNCTCHLLEFRNFALVKPIISLLTACQHPPQLKGRTWNKVQPEQFACRPEIIQPLKRIPTSSTYGEPYSENITLECRIRASPQPRIAWTYNKRVINVNDRRYHLVNTVEPTLVDDMSTYISELSIKAARTNDRGVYGCIAENVAGKDSLEMEVAHSYGRGVDVTHDEDISSNLLLIISIVAIVLLILLVLVVCLLCLYCRRAKRFSKDSTMSENALMASKLDKSQNSSMLEGSVITEMQKSLLTSVNPVEKPPRRTTDLDSVDTDDGHEIKKTLLDDAAFGSHDEESNSIALSDTTPRSRQTFVDDGHGTNLPPDLLSFQAKVPHSPSMQSSISNFPDNRIYAKSPLASPVYQHVISNQSPVHPMNTGIYGGTPVAFRTLQHPKNRNLTLLATPRAANASPFVPAPVIYSPVVMKQGYMTIPRKPRVPSWTPSCSTTLSEFQPAHSQADGTESLKAVELEPVYDNLGVRTTAGGNSYLNLTKIGAGASAQSPASRYTMKDRPLPATPNVSKVSSAAATPSRIYEPIHELANLAITSDTEPLYGTAKNGGHGVTIVPSNMNGMPATTSGTLDRIAKIPPRPPPKPKKKISITSTSQGSTSQLFEDEGEDGTEV